MPYDHAGKFVSMNAALDAWTPLAVDLLTERASVYQGFVTYKELADFVKTRSGIGHDGLLTNWIGSLLARVIGHCSNTQVPQLSSLCVREDGSVGEGYRHAAAAIGDEATLDELDDHAARTRLDCYKHFGAELPPGGGLPTLTPRAQAARDWRRSQSKSNVQPKICPGCYVALPVTGLCDHCQ
ncbi:hypothetical protein [Mycolicibacterium frederiksbergense]|uniref:hypothetical protein n=1 Tax=Mycolicibacterium frederiksbergense TaxID=117567 RepID=UPI00399A0511